MLSTNQESMSSVSLREAVSISSDEITAIGQPTNQRTSVSVHRHIPTVNGDGHTPQCNAPPSSVDGNVCITSPCVRVSETLPSIYNHHYALSDNKWDTINACDYSNLSHLSIQFRHSPNTLSVKKIVCLKNSRLNRDSVKKVVNHQGEK